MQLAPRLIAVTTGTLFLASALAGALLVRMEHEQLVTDKISESRTLLRSLQVAMENAKRDGQEPDITELLGRLDHVAAQVDVLVFNHGVETPVQTSVGSVYDDENVRQIRALTRTQDEIFRIIPSDGHETRLVAGMPLRTDAGERIGALILDRKLTELDADLYATTLLITWSVLAFALITTAVLLIFLRREITRPLSQIVDATRRLSADLESHLQLQPAPSDEFDAVRATLLQLQSELLRVRDARVTEASQREELERQLREADKLVVVGQLAAGVAHEIGSPLQVMIGRARMLASDTARSAETHRQAHLIVDHAERIASIVGRLQDVVRRHPTRPRSIDLRKPVEKVMWLLEPEARRRAITLVSDSSPDRVVIHADPDEVQQVTLNLALNALQATASGGRVTVSVQPDPHGGLLRVADNGRGMDNTTKELAFEAFFTTRSHEEGSGLGLSIVKTIVDRHKAHITLESWPSTGTTVSVTWPREEES